MTLFLKLGGSLITDKTAVEAVRPVVLKRVAQEIAQAYAQMPGLRLLLGHGSGSFGHVVAAHHGTRQGVQTAAEWRGFAEVSVTAARLNKLVVEALQVAGLPALTLQPSASVLCENGRLQTIAVEPIQRALAAGLLPVVHGDVAFDRSIGGTIVSTEEVMMGVAAQLPPRWLLLAGETDGVYDENGVVIPQITPRNLPDIAAALGGSRGTDVTGGMVSKVEGMLTLAMAQPGLRIRLFSGLTPGLLTRLLLAPETAVGTELSA